MFHKSIRSRSAPWQLVRKTESYSSKAIPSPPFILLAFQPFFNRSKNKKPTPRNNAECQSILKSPRSILFLLHPRSYCSPHPSSPAPASPFQSRQAVSSLQPRPPGPSGCTCSKSHLSLYIHKSNAVIYTIHINSDFCS